MVPFTQPQPVLFGQPPLSNPLAPGAYLIGGGSHNSVAVEFTDFVTVIEGPLSNQRTNAVVAEVHKLFPNKPIRYLVNTHNHFSAGYYAADWENCKNSLINFIK